MANILIVEDESALERIFTMNLNRLNHSVFEARTLAQAEEIMHLGVESIDLVLLDINLPDGTGWDFIRHWRSHYPAMKIIVATAVAPSHARIAEFAPDAVLVKPFPITTLLQLVDRVLSGENDDQSLVYSKGATSSMADLLFAVVTIASFGVLIAFVAACDKLIRREK